MSYYAAIGEDAVSEPGIRTPGFVLSEMESVDAAIGSLARDMVAQPQASANLRQPYAVFAQEWVNFFSEHTGGPVAWLARGTTPVYDKTLSFRERYKQWRAAFVAAGGKVSMIDTIDARPRGGFSLWPWLIAGGAVFLAVHLIYKPRSPRYELVTPGGENT